MPERVVVCGGLRGPPGSKDLLRLDVDARAGSPHKINLRLPDLARQMADDIPHVLADMLEIAAYVYCADQFTTRGSNLMSHMGAAWRRQFRFIIPVRCPDIWNGEELRNALVETLSFLTEDEYRFEFAKRTTAAGLEPYLGFDDPAAHAINPDEVILFSGGLDSMAGAVEALVDRHARVVLVSQQSSTMIASKQHALLGALRERTAKGQLFHVPMTINKGQEEAVEFTQRSRSLLFATLGLIVARMFGRSKVSFYENGVVSFNLPIAEHVLGTRASRTTHPRFLADCSRLFSILLGRSFRLENPFLWKTKTEVVRFLAQFGFADQIGETLSCTRVREATQRKKHCGTCSQCVDRRFAVLAAGLGEYEPAESYAIDLFQGEHRLGRDLTMVESYVVRAHKLATSSEFSFLASCGQIFRAIRYLPGSPDDNARAIFDLHRRHGIEVIDVVDGELTSNASLVKTLSVPKTSLLAMVVSAMSGQHAYADPVEYESPVSVQAPAGQSSYQRTPTIFAIDVAGKRVLFHGGPSLTGAAFRLVSALALEFEEDIASERPHDAHRFVRADVLAGRLRVEEQSLRQCVSRTRRSLDKQFLTLQHIQVDQDDIIQNQEWKGYRLNPYLLLVHPGQLPKQLGTSHLPAEDVTTPNSAAPNP